MEKKTSQAQKEKLQAVEELRKRIFAATKADQEGHPDAQCGDLITSHPLLHSLLFMHYLDGGPAEGATLVIWGADDGLGALLNVKPWGRKAFFRAGSLRELLDACEGHIANPEAKWQADKPRKPSKQRFSGKPH